LKVIDLHCDVLMKMLLNPKISFLDSDELAVNYQKLHSTEAKLQFFAIYIPEDIHPQMRFQAALAMVHIFHEKILSFPHMKLIKSREDYLLLREGEIGAVLCLEGCDCLNGDLIKLYTLLQLGVSSVGLTWNYSNVFADGALEVRNAGLSEKGKQLVSYLNEKSIMIDVSHLSEASFWDVIELGGEIFASHSNCRAICDHPRNLFDDQIKSLLKRNGLIGLTFVPSFVTKTSEATIKDLISHVDHICSLGGVRKIGFGSDFDGTPGYIKEIVSYKDYPLLIEELLKHYTYEQVEGFLYKNYENVIILKNGS